MYYHIFRRQKTSTMSQDTYAVVSPCDRSSMLLGQEKIRYACGLHHIRLLYFYNDEAPLHNWIVYFLFSSSLDCHSDCSIAYSSSLLPAFVSNARNLLMLPTCVDFSVKPWYMANNTSTMRIELQTGSQRCKMRHILFRYLRNELALRVPSIDLRLCSNFSISFTGTSEG